MGRIKGLVLVLVAFGWIAFGWIEFGWIAFVHGIGGGVFDAPSKPGPPKVGKASSGQNSGTPERLIRTWGGVMP